MKLYSPLPQIYEIGVVSPKFCEENIIVKTNTHKTILTCHSKDWSKLISIMHFS